MDATTKISSQDPPPLPPRISYGSLLASFRNQCNENEQLLKDFANLTARQSDDLCATELLKFLYQVFCCRGPCGTRSFINTLLRDNRVMVADIVAKAANDSVVQLLRELVRSTRESDSFIDRFETLYLFSNILVLCGPQVTDHEQSRIAVLFKSCATGLPRESLWICLWIFTRPDFVQIDSADWTRTFLQSLEDIYVDLHEDHDLALLESDLKMLASTLRYWAQPLFDYEQFRADVGRCGYTLPGSQNEGVFRSVWRAFWKVGWPRSWSLRKVFRGVLRGFWEVGWPFCCR